MVQGPACGEEIEEQIEVAKTTTLGVSVIGAGTLLTTTSRSFGSVVQHFVQHEAEQPINARLLRQQN